jgi:hypothetical protein
MPVLANNLKLHVLLHLCTLLQANGKAQGSAAINVQLPLKGIVLKPSEDENYHGCKLRALWLPVTAGWGGARQCRNKRAAVT